jgi:hypothetical protein
LKVKGGVQYRRLLAGKRQANGVDVARTAIANAINLLVAQFDEQALRDLFPNATGDALFSVAMLKFVRTHARDTIAAAITKAGHDGVLALKTWRQDLLDLVDEGVGDLGGQTGPKRKLNEIDEMLKDIVLSPEDRAIADSLLVDGPCPYAR